MSRIKYHNGTEWVYADMAVQTGETPDITMSGTSSSYPAASDYQSATYTSTKTMTELINKFNATGKVDIGGVITCNEQGGTIIKVGAQCIYGNYVPYSVATTYQSILTHTIDNGVDALLLKITDRANNISTGNWGLVVYQSGGSVYCDIETVM